MVDATRRGEAVKHILTIFVAVGAVIAAACVLALIYGATTILGHVLGK